MVHRGGALGSQLEEVCWDWEAGLGGGRLGQCIPLLNLFHCSSWLQYLLSHLQEPCQKHLLLMLVLGRSPAASCKESAHWDATVRVSALAVIVMVGALE